MCKCLKLSKLPKASGPKSVAFRHNTPGSPLPLVIPHIPYDPRRAFYPSHPATRLRPAEIPSFNCPAFTIRAVPKAALIRPDVEREHTNPVKGRVKDGQRVQMSLLFVVGKKATDKRAFVRRRITSRIKTVIGLIVTRGADSVLSDQNSKEDQAGRNRQLPGRTEEDISSLKSKGTAKIGSSSSSYEIVFKPGDICKSPDNQEWVLRDWTYVLIPSLLVYRLPLPELVLHVRIALQHISRQARDLEASWRLLHGQEEVQQGDIQAHTQTSLGEVLRRNLHTVPSEVPLHGDHEVDRAQLTSGKSRKSPKPRGNRPFGSEPAEVSDRASSDPQLFSASLPIQLRVGSTSKNVVPPSLSTLLSALSAPSVPSTAAEPHIQRADSITTCTPSPSLPRKMQSATLRLFESPPVILRSSAKNAEVPLVTEAPRRRGTGNTTDKNLKGIKRQKGRGDLKKCDAT